MKRALSLSLLSLFLFSAEAQAGGTLPKNTTDARAIMEAVDARDVGDKVLSRTEMTLSDGKGRTRTRTFVTRALKFPGGTKSVTFFESPADVRNTALLSIDYDDGKKADDQWLYLPSLHRATRITSSGKSGAFMGSDFTYADLTRPDPDDYDFKLLEQSTMVDGDECWRIEATPRNDRVRKETGYLKSELWVSKDKLMIVQSKAWLSEGQKLKYVKGSDFKKTNGIWNAHVITARTVRGGRLESETVLKSLSLSYDNESITESDFTERRLEQGL